MIFNTQRQFRYKTGISAKLEWERVNEGTWKLTNGEMTNVPACHGFWPGYRTSEGQGQPLGYYVNELREGLRKGAMHLAA